VDSSACHSTRTTSELKRRHERRRRSSPRDVGRAVAYMAELPLESNVLSMTVMATEMPFVGRG
jgi:NADP-dependent 3-hydroxy acid dehydrogenase YdfG